MTQQHPTTPPPELVRQWQKESLNDPTGSCLQAIANRAAQWGADQELDACCGWLLDSAPWTVGPGERIEWVETLAMCRRPKPPSLKEQSLAFIDKIQASREPWLVEELDIVRRALEGLSDD